MTSPRHLWSGDWIRDSATAEEELARQRAQPRPVAQRPVQAPPAPAPPSTDADRPPPKPARARRHRRLARARLAGLLVLVVAVGTGIAVVTDPFGTGQPSPGSASPQFQPPEPWLGLTTTGSPTQQGAVVTHVVPGGPSDQAGLVQGDVITAVNAQPIVRPSDINSVVDSQLVGAEVLLQVDRGGSLQTVGVTLMRRPAGSP